MVSNWRNWLFGKLMVTVTGELQLILAELKNHTVQLDAIIQLLSPPQLVGVKIVFGKPVKNLRPLKEKENMAFPLMDDQHVSCSVQFVDDAVPPNPVPVPAGATMTWGSSDSTVMTVVADSSDPTGMTAVATATGKLGVATVQGQVMVPGDPKSPYTLMGGDVVVGVGQFSTVDVVFGTATHN